MRAGHKSQRLRHIYQRHLLLVLLPFQTAYFLQSCRHIQPSLQLVFELLQQFWRQLISIRLFQSLLAAAECIKRVYKDHEKKREAIFWVVCVYCFLLANSNPTIAIATMIAMPTPTTAA